MFDDEGFEQVGMYPGDEVVMRIPGMRVRLPYDTGIAMLNIRGNIGYGTLDIKDIVAEEDAETADQGAVQGMLLRSQYAPELIDLVRKVITSAPMRLFYSLGTDETQLITMPGVYGEDADEKEYFDDLVAAIYPLHGIVPTPQPVFLFHESLAYDRDTVTDRSRVGLQMQLLPMRVNKIYEQRLQLMLD